MKRSSLRLGLILACVLAALPALAGGSFPSPEHPWTKRDYVDFYFAHYNGNQALPHLRNAEGRALIERLVDPENVTRIVEGPASLADKRLQIATILMAAGAGFALGAIVAPPLAMSALEEEELRRQQAQSGSSDSGGDDSGDWGDDDWGGDGDSDDDFG